MSGMPTMPEVNDPRVPTTPVDDEVFDDEEDFDDDEDEDGEGEDFDDEDDEGYADEE